MFEAREAYPLESSLLLAKFQQLYDLEDRAKTFSADERLALRQAEAAPVWASIYAWLASEAAARILPKSKFAEALNYLRNHREALTLYLTDGRMPIDNNDTEQLMKQGRPGSEELAVHRKRRGGRAGSRLPDAGQRGHNDLDVVYVKDVLDQLLAGSTDYHACVRTSGNTRGGDPQYRVRARDRADRRRFTAQRRIAATREPLSGLFCHGSAAAGRVVPHRLPGRVRRTSAATKREPRRRTPFRASPDRSYGGVTYRPTGCEAAPARAE